MKVFKLTLIILFALSLKGYSQDVLPVKYRVEKQSMSVPMSPLEDVFFSGSYYSKPMNIDFNGESLKMYYDNNRTFLKKEVTKVDYEAEYDEDIVIFETSYFTYNDSPSDTIMFIVDHEVPYIQLVLPTKNASGEKVGYTSYKKYVSVKNLALN